MLNKKRLVMMGSVVMLSISSVGCGATPKVAAVGFNGGTEVGVEQEDTTGSYNIQSYDEETGEAVAVNGATTNDKGTASNSGSSKSESEKAIESMNGIANNIVDGMFTNTVNRGANHKKSDNASTTTVASNTPSKETVSGNTDSKDDTKKDENKNQATENQGTSSKSETPKNESNGSSTSNPSGSSGNSGSNSSSSKPSGNSGGSSSKPSGSSGNSGSNSSSSKPSGNSGSNSSSSKPSGNSGGSSSKPSGGSNTPVKQECSHDWVADYKTVHHDAVTHVVHHPAGSHKVHHDAVTHTVHHDAVTHTVHHDAEGYWTQRQWVVTQAANPGTTVTVLHCDCGFFTTDESAMANHRESKLLEGDYSHGRGWHEQVTQGATPEQGYWKEPEWIQTKAAWDEVVVDKAAYDEVVVDKAAWDETVVDSKAWDETVVDKAAYVEKVINGYHCSKCGKTK